MKTKRGASRVSLICMAGSVLACAAALVMYLLTGRNEFNTSLSQQVIVPLILAILLGGGMLIRPVRIVKYAAYLCGLYAWLEYLCSQIYYIVNVFVAIDGTRFSAAFIVTLLTGLPGWLLALLSAVKQPENVAGEGEAS